MTLHDLNTMPAEQRSAELYKCCGSANWVKKMQTFFPADDLVEILEDAEAQWTDCTEADWLEAFTQHPKIGDVESLRTKFATTADWASGEQGGAADATTSVIEELAEYNKIYEAKFGFIFIVCATGKTAAEMLALLKARLPHYREQEIKIAADEQNKITLLRLQKLLA